MRDAGNRRLGATVALLLAGCPAPADGPGSGLRGSHEARTGAGPEPSEGGRGHASESSGAPAPTAPEHVEPVPAEPAAPWPQPPAGYGELALSVPAPAEGELVLHGLAGYEVVAVYDKPSVEARKIGFIRFGQRVRVTHERGAEDCPKGWHQLQGGGFACASKGLVVEARPPFMKHEPPPPRLDEAFPYEWAYVRKWNIPMWWRLPTTAELAVMKEEQAKREVARTSAAVDAAAADAGSAANHGAASDTGSAAPEDVAGAGQLPGVEQATDSAGAPSDPAPASDPDGPTQADPAEPEHEPVLLPLNPQHPWLEKGFFISVAGSVREEGRSYWRTARGGFVSQAETFKYEPKDFRGIDLTGEMTWPVGFADSAETKIYELGADDKLKAVETVERRTAFSFEEEVEHAGKTYMRIADGRLVRKEQVVMPDLQGLPKGLQPWERWIDVSLSKQMLVAYEGTRPVYVTLVSTGKKGSEEEPFRTPSGRWRIYSKQVTSNMDGATATDGNYAIQDVPWVMYFDASYALHGAFWHRSFGRVRSHGCVNLGPSDARWLFNWTTPFLPEGWHGVHATDESPGSTVIVRE